MPIIINSRKYKMEKQFEMLDLGMPDEFETKEDVLKALKILDETVEEYKSIPKEPFKGKQQWETKINEENPSLIEINDIEEKKI